MKRAADAPANPPPITTTRGPVPCASAGRGSNAAAPATLRKSRRLLCATIERLLLLRLIPCGDRLDFLVGESFGDAIHDGAGPLAGFVCTYLAGDIGRRPSDTRGHRRIDARSGAVIARAGSSPGRSTFKEGTTGRAEH